MRPEIFISRRLTLGNGEKTPLGLIIGVTGVALAFVVMLIAVSVVSGFKNEIRRKLMGFEPQLLIEPGRPTPQTAEVALPLRFSHEMAAEITEALGTEAKADTVGVLQGILKTDSAFSGIVIKCVSPGSESARFIASDIVARADSVDPADPEALTISGVTARKLGVKPGDRLFAHFLTDGNLRTRRLKVAAIYNTYFDDYDAIYAFAPLRLAGSVSGATDPAQCSQIEINGIAPDRLDIAKSRLENRFIERAIATRGTTDIPMVSSVDERGALYLNWLDLLDTNVVVIITLMTAVAGFTIISSLFILIIQRVSTIGLLKAIGATDRQIRGIFIAMAQKIVARGLILGNLIGGAFILIQHFTHIVPLDPAAYYLSYVPVEINLWGWILLNLSAVAVAFLILVLPSRAISKMDVATTLKEDRQ